MKKTQSARSSRRQKLSKNTKRRKAAKAKKTVVVKKKVKEVLNARQLEEVRLKRLEKRRERDRRRRAIKNADRLSNTLTTKEREIEAIERSTQCGEGFGRETFKTLVDVALLAGFADPDEIANEERVCRHSDHVSKHDDDVADGEVSAFLEGRPSFESTDFRDGIAEECDCQGDEVCINCCTHRDLMTLPPAVAYSLANKRQKVIGSKMEEVFDLVLPRQVAIQVGFIAA